MVSVSLIDHCLCICSSVHPSFHPSTRGGGREGGREGEEAGKGWGGKGCVDGWVSVGMNGWILHPALPFPPLSPPGECTGLPYTERFPVIPTYGLEELTGWFPSADPVQEELRHPLGRHNPHGKHMFSRSVLMHSKDDWIYLTPFISSEIPMPVKNVPLSGVKVLVSKWAKYIYDST